MPNYFFTASDGNRWGPLSEQRLQTLIDQGIITPTTSLETDTGHTGLTGQIPGLNFNATEPIPSTQSAQAIPQRTRQLYSQQSEKANAGTIMSWIFDFAFRDLRLPVVNLWVCRILYAFCWVGTGLFVILTALALFASAAGGDGVLPRYAPAMLAFCLVVLPFLLIVVRLILELEIMTVDWLSEATKAARKYNDQ